mmetsp:Transcript_6913/g.13057  ORF Transcript_6913/g.13057 Transcript_6913/m.13057 type:complete len:228 (-) Transcript_6913:211-894(-)
MPPLLQNDGRRQEKEKTRCTQSKQGCHQQLPECQVVRVQGKFVPDGGGDFDTAENAWRHCSDGPFDRSHQVLQEPRPKRPLFPLPLLGEGVLDAQETAFAHAVRRLGWVRESAEEQSAGPAANRGCKDQQLLAGARPGNPAAGQERQPRAVPRLHANHAPALFPWWACVHLGGGERRFRADPRGRVQLYTALRFACVLRQEHDHSQHGCGRGERAEGVGVHTRVCAR